MRAIIDPRVNLARYRGDDKYGTEDQHGHNGMFHFDLKGETLRVIASDSRGHKACGLPPWEHVSVSCKFRCPTWDEMCYVKDLFWAPHEAVMQLHPPKKDYVNHHPYCLHLWKPMEATIPLPPKIMVGPS